MIDYEIKYIADRKHTAADDLFKRSHIEENILIEQQEQDINDFINAKLNSLKICSISINSDEVSEKKMLRIEYNDKFERIIAILTLLQRSIELNRKKFRTFKSETLRYRVQDDHLYKRNSKNVSFRRVIDSDKKKLKILKQLYDESEHKNRKNTYRNIANR